MISFEAKGEVSQAPAPSVAAMRAAVELEIQAALGHVQTRTIGEMIDRAVVVVAGWRPIETAPKGAVVILYFPPKVTGAYKQSSLPAMYRVDRADAYPSRPPSHWMPLPEPPK